MINKSFISLLKSGDRKTLAKAITLIESKNIDHRREAEKLIEIILPYTGNSKRIGISGVTGSGKSTLINFLGLSLIKNGYKVAVLAVDPTSPINGGSLLGDKTRMEELSMETNSFIRPSPSGNSLGGITTKTREVILLCEAAGYDFVIVETLGVGQSEHSVHDLVDLFTVILNPGTGDDIQGIKKGIIELADILIINKADGYLLKQAEITYNDYNQAILIQNREIPPEVFLLSALKNIGIKKVFDSIELFFKKNNLNIEKRRKKQSTLWMHQLIEEQIKNIIKNDITLNKEINEYETQINKGNISPINASKKIVQQIFKINPLI